MVLCWTLQCVNVCVFLLCHSDDVALASRHSGATAQPCPSMLNVPGHSKLPRTSGSQGLLGSGISQWEETAEACVASALANTHMHTTPIYDTPSIIPSPSFFQSAGARHPQRPRPTKVKGRGGGQWHTEEACWVITSSLFELIMCKNLPVKLMSQHFLFHTLVFCFVFFGGGRVETHLILFSCYSDCRSSALFIANDCRFIIK